MRKLESFLAGLLLAFFIAPCFALEIDELPENTAPPLSAEYELQLTGGGTSQKSTLDNMLDAGLESGSGAPASTPDRLGKIYIDTTAGDIYVSKGTSSSADWVLTNDDTDTQLSNAQVESAYNTQVSAASQAEMEAGTVTDIRRMTPERIKQAIEALAPTGGDGEEIYAASVLADVTLASLTTTLTIVVPTGECDSVFIRGNFKTDRASQTWDTMDIAFNNNTTSTAYYRQRLQAVGTGVTGVVAEDRYIAGILGNTAPADSFSNVDILITGVSNSSNNIQAKATSGSRESPTSNNLRLVELEFESTSNLTEIDLTSGAGDDFVSGTNYIALCNKTMNLSAASVSVGWTTYSAGDSWTSDPDVTGTFAYYVHGPFLYIRGRLDLTGAPPNAGLTFNLPGSYEADNTVIANAANVSGWGQVRLNDSGTATELGTLRLNTVTELEVMRLAGNDFGVLNASVPHTWATGDKITLDAVIPLSSGVIPGNVSDWIAYTPTLGWTSNASASCYYKTIGSDELKVRCAVTTTGAPAGGTLTVSLPSGLAIDTTKMLDNTTTGFVIGELYLRTSGGGDRLGIVVTNNSTTTVRAAYYTLITGGNNDPIDFASLTSTAPVTIASGDKVNLNFSVPIQ